jgi:hypothetical protein
MTPIRNRWIVLGTFNLGVLLFCLWNYHSGAATRQVALIVSTIVLVIGNAGLLFSFRKHRKQEGTPAWSNFAPAAVVFAIISFTITAFGVSHLQDPNDYLRIAMSTTPFSSIHPERRRLVVEFLRKRAAYSRQNNKDLADASLHPINPPLYSPESFANKAVMASTIATLTKFMDIDLHYDEQLQDSAQSFRQKMELCDPAYLKSWNESIEETEGTQAPAMRAERDWFASVTSLYSYAEGHANDITLKSGKLIITPTSVLDAFNQQMTNSKDLQQKQSDLVTLQLKQQ